MVEASLERGQEIVISIRKAILNPPVGWVDQEGPGARPGQVW